MIYSSETVLLVFVYQLGRLNQHPTTSKSNQLILCVNLYSRRLSEQLTMKSSAITKNGSIIAACEWSDNKHLYQEYFISVVSLPPKLD